MNNFKGVVYLTEAQYVTLKTTGSITVGNTTIVFDENTLYVTPDRSSEVLANLQAQIDALGGEIGDIPVVDLTAIEESITELDGRVTTLEDKKQQLFIFRRLGNDSYTSNEDGSITTSLNYVSKNYDGSKMVSTEFVMTVENMENVVTAHNNLVNRVATLESSVGDLNTALEAILGV